MPLFTLSNPCVAEYGYGNLVDKCAWNALYGCPLPTRLFLFNPDWRRAVTHQSEWKGKKRAKNQKTQAGHEFSVCIIFYVYLNAVCLLQQSPFLIKMQSFAPGVPARVRAIGDCARPRPLLLPSPPVRPRRARQARPRLPQSDHTCAFRWAANQCCAVVPALAWGSALFPQALAVYHVSLLRNAKRKPSPTPDT